MSGTATKQSLSTLALGAIGVVFGDIGTSPLYTIHESFAGAHPIPIDAPHVMGVLSTMFWTIMLLVSFKYVALVMRADNHGEGGVLALLALILDKAQASTRSKWLLGVVSIIAAALFYGDSMITPAVSVLSAVEGMQVIAPDLKTYVLPVTIAVITLLFWVQKRGSNVVGMAFGPIMVVWFLCLGIMGANSISQSPEILHALNPAYAYEFFSSHWTTSFLAMGGIVLAITGGEALYADMGHFGKAPIRLSWYGFVLPALVLNYFGQGALLLHNQAAIENPFYLLAPSWALVPLVILATAATVIASQAVISGAFSIAHQSVQMGMLPRMPIIQTSGLERGQVYVPFTNWTLYIAVIYLVLTFQTSSNLAAAYGIAVTGTMTITTILIGFVMITIWKWPLYRALPVIMILLATDLTYFAANIIKIPQGGWFPLSIAALSFTVLTTWRRGRQLLMDQVKRLGIPVEVIIDGTAETPRVEGTAIFLVSEVEGAPSALMHNVKHNKVLHERNILLTIIVQDQPYVADEKRVYIKELGRGFYRMKLHYGFMETPDIPVAMALCSRHGLVLDAMETSFFISRAMITIGEKTGMAQWRGRLFLAISKNAMNAADFFKIPANRVIEMGTRIEI